ncbi:MAG: class I SAM-dependent methyltransferase [Opitutaceae bacterium]
MAFTTAAQLARRPKVFADYLVHRYANTSFLSAIGPLLLIRSLVNIGQSDDGMPPRVLDVGCGAGHATFLMSLLYPETSIVSADQDFVNVYLARRFLAPEAIHLCIDAEVPVPFPDNSFDAVFCLDAFHYLRSKKAIVTELTRILKASGAWVFPHLHNKLQPNFTAGIPLSPEGYLKCFEAANPKLFDEAAVLRSLSAGRPPDWQTGSDPRDLTGCPNLTMIGGLRGDAEINSSSLAALNPISQYLQINPIFKVHRTRSAFRASFEWPNKVMASECAAVEEFIPSEVELTPDSLGKLQRGNWDWEDPEVRGLITRFVAVPLPSRYTPHTVPAGNDGG